MLTAIPRRKFALIALVISILGNASAAFANAPVRGSGAYRLKLVVSPQANDAFAVKIDLNKALLPSDLSKAFLVLRPIDAQVSSASSKSAENAQDSASTGAIRIPLAKLLKGEKISFKPLGLTLSGARAQVYLGPGIPALYANLFVSREADGSFKPTTLGAHYARLRKHGLAIERRKDALVGVKKPFRREKFEESLRFESQAKEPSR